MYAAKEAQCDFKVYAANQNQHSVRRLSVLSDIRRALSSDEIVVHFQPIVELDELTGHSVPRAWSAGSIPSWA